MDLPDLVNHARIKEDPLGEGGLAGIDVRRNSNVARPLEREGSIGRIMLERALASSVADMAKTGCVHDKPKHDRLLRSSVVENASVCHGNMIEIPAIETAKA